MKLNFIFQLLFLLLFCFLQGCASSDLSRQAAGNVDQTYDCLVGTACDAGTYDLAESYQNLSQTTKGILIGGIAGGVVGGASSGVGVAAGSATGAILGGSIGAYIDAHSNLVDRLENRGVKVIVLGDQVMIVLPTNRIFNGVSSAFHSSASTTLDMVNQLIGCFVNISVRVTAYVDPAAGPEQINLSLTQQQAEKIGKYLWHHCQVSRIMYAVGCGGSRPVQRSTSNWLYSDNNRIEITFEKLPV